MTQSDKDLLLKDLCARVPYVTFVYIEREVDEDVMEIIEDGDEEPNIHTLISCNYYGECDIDDSLYETVYHIKPYLRPMSSMTEEERNDFYHNRTFHDGRMWESEGFDVDWLNEHHFDYRGLIEKGLALEATEGMYKTE